MTQLIEPKKFTEATTALRSFFLSKGFEEVHTQNRLSQLQYRLRSASYSKTEMCNSESF